LKSAVAIAKNHKFFFAKLFDWQINVQGPAALINTGSKDGIRATSPRSDMSRTIT